MSEGRSVKVQSMIFGVALLLTGQPVVGKSDPMCGPLRAFVKSVQPDESKRFEFHTSWGSNFRDSDEPAVFAKRCSHYGDGAAKKVCAYLMEYGVTEFSGNNFRRAVMCLSKKTRIDQEVSISGALIFITFGTPSRGSSVQLEFTDDPVIGGMVLKVVAEGY